MSNTTVDDWLRSLGFLNYVQAFIDNGYDDLDICKQIGDEDLDAIGVINAKDRNGILASVQSLKNHGVNAVYFRFEAEVETTTPKYVGQNDREKYQRDELINKMKSLLADDNCVLPENNPNIEHDPLVDLAQYYADQLHTYFQDVKEVLEYLRDGESNEGVEELAHSSSPKLPKKKTAKLLKKSKGLSKSLNFLDTIAVKNEWQKSPKHGISRLFSGKNIYIAQPPKISSPEETAIITSHVHMSEDDKKSLMLQVKCGDITQNEAVGNFLSYEATHAKDQEKDKTNEKKETTKKKGGLLRLSSFKRRSSGQSSEILAADIQLGERGRMELMRKIKNKEITTEEAWHQLRRFGSKRESKTKCPKVSRKGSTKSPRPRHSRISASSVKLFSSTFYDGTNSDFSQSTSNIPSVTGSDSSPDSTPGLPRKPELQQGAKSAVQLGSNGSIESDPKNPDWTVERHKKSQGERNNDEIDEKDPISDVPEYSFSVIEGSGQTSDNSVTISEKGGCFHVPVASAFLVFPPNAIEEEVTLMFSRVRHKECEVKPRDGEVFVSQILKIEAEGVKFKKPVTVLLSHSLYEDQDFLYFYELIVENLTPSGCQELKTERIRSIEDVPKKISNKEFLINYLPFAKATIHETCTLVAATRVKSEHISVPTNRSYTFSKQYGDSAQLKITFPAGVAEEILSLKVQLLPADAVLKKEIRLDKNLVCAPVIRVSGQTTTFLKAVDVELTYSHSDVVNIEDEFLRVGKTIQFTTEHGLLLRSQKETDSITKWLNLNESIKVCIERPRKDQLRFSFSVEHFSDVQPVVKTRAVSFVPPINDGMVDNNNPAVHRAIVLAVHETVSSPKRLHAVLAPNALLYNVEKNWNVKNENKIRKLNIMVRSGEPIYFCVPMSEDNDDDHLPLKDYTLMFDPDPELESILDNNTEENVDLNGKYMHFLKDNECNNGKNHRVAVGQDCCAKAPIHILKEARPVQNVETVIESSSTIAPRQENGASSSQGYAHDSRVNSQNEVMGEDVKRLCKRFEDQIVTKFLEKLKINKKNPDVGEIADAIDDAGTVTAIILSIGVGTAIALSIGSFGIGSFVGAAVLGVTFTVKKYDKKLKTSKAKKLDEKANDTLYCLEYIIIDVAKELSRMFEYQIVELKRQSQIDTLAECAVDLMLDVKKGDLIDRNTLIKKVLQDGKAEKRELLTRNGDKWSAPNVFRKPGLQRANVVKDRAELIYKVKRNDACDTKKYGYRGQFLEMKKYGSDDEEDEKVLEEKPAKGKDENHTHEDPCKELCKECFNYKNNSSGLYFAESHIDCQYTETRYEVANYHPMHILVQCPKVLDYFICNQLQEEKPSLANYLRNKLGLPEHHLVHPVYRPHSPGKVLDLQKSNLTGSDFSHSDFTNACLDECDFTNCVMLFVELEGAKMSRSEFCNTVISHCNLKAVDATYSSWIKTPILYSIVDGMDLRNTTTYGDIWEGTNVDKTIRNSPTNFNETNDSVQISGKTQPARPMQADHCEGTNTFNTCNDEEIELQQKMTKLNCNGKVKADHCEGTKTLLLNLNVDGVSLDCGEPSTSRNFLDGPDICDAIPGKGKKLKGYETIV